MRDSAAQKGILTSVVSSYAPSSLAVSTGLLSRPRTTGTLTSSPFLEGKSQARGARLGPRWVQTVHTEPTQRCVPRSAKLPSGAPGPLLWLSEASRIHYHTNVRARLLRTWEFCLRGAPRGAGGGAQPLEQEARGARCRWAGALCSARPGGCYGKQPTCVCHGEHGRAIVCF